MTWQRINLAEPEYAIPSEPPTTCGLIYRGKRHLLSGPPEALKTLAALIFGLEHMRAGHGAFAFFDFEQDGPSVRLMLDELGANLAEIASVHYFQPSGPPDDGDIAALAAAGVTLAAIDAAAGAYDVSGLDDNKRQDAERFAGRWVTPLWRASIATLVLDHVVKSAEARGRFAIGTERKAGQVDVHLGLEAVKQLARGGSGIVRITVHKDRPGHLRGHVPELHLESDPESHGITWTFAQAAATASDNGWRPTALMEKVSRYVREQGEPISRNAIERAKLGKQATFVRQAIDALTAEGYLRETAGSRGSRMYESVKPFTSSDLVSLRPDEDAFTSSDLVYPLQGDEVTDEDEVARLMALYRDEVA